MMKQQRHALFIVGVMTLLHLVCFPGIGLARAQAKAPLKLEQLVQHPALSPTQTGIMITSLKTGAVIYQKNPDTPLTPASNMKLLTSAAALALLKPEFRFKTVLYRRGDVNNGVLKGDLYLKGFGDPDLTDARLRDLVREVKYHGIETIEGNLFLDDSYFDQMSTGKGWKDNYGAAAYHAYISALSLNQNTVTVWVRPTSPGKPAAITLDPPTRFFGIINQTVTNNSRTRLKITRYLDNEGKNQIRVSGNIYAKAQPEVETINLEKPTLYTGTVFQALLEEAGIKLKGQLKIDLLPQESIQLLAMTHSRPLRAIIAELNKESVNMIAEHLLKFLGAAFEGTPGSAEKGAKVIQEDFLRDMVGITPSGIMIADGSGLSRFNRLTPRMLNQVLTYMANRFDLSMDYLSSLAIAGVDGTLRNRLTDVDTRRMIRAKTGFINGVSALSGYLHTASDDTLVFSMLMNNFSNYSVARSVQDQVCSVLVYY